jgi:2,3-bisphosphoglycerate-independent phosphoglycerate mutase
MKKKPILLCILDGWGIGDENSDHNAIARANTPNYDRILKTYPSSKLATSGLAVGLPESQIGNSEVGHSTIGAGRIVFQDLPKINIAIEDGSFEKNPRLQNLISDLQNTDKTCNILGLFSDGGVHSHKNHIIFLAKFLAKNNVKVNLHIFLDGRDTAQKAALHDLKKLINEIFNYEKIKIATICGRYYAMDRDQRWERIKVGYDAIVSGAAQTLVNSDNIVSAIEESYKNNITDEFMLPVVINDYKTPKDNDAIIFANFRSDRARELSSALLDPYFNKFPTRKINFSHKISFTEYSDKLNEFYDVLFPKVEVKNSLPETLSNLGMTQLRIAETEKYAHITFFFNCGKESEFAGEKRVLISSPKVSTYDLQPEMSALEVGKTLRELINTNEFDFIVVNYANPDMVGHTGVLTASIKACEAIDNELAMLEKLILEKNGAMIISADHGNIECMLDENKNPHTSHTLNLVPFILIGCGNKNLLDGDLSDIAPTILEIMNIEKPIEMSGKSLIKNE